MKGSAFGLFKRAALLRCPRCGEGALFAGLFNMNANCPVCFLVFEREQGYFVGAIYVNYAVTVMIVLPGYFVLEVWAGPSLFWQLALWIPFAAIFPLLFFRHSRSLWLSMEYFFNPAERLQAIGKGEARKSTGR